MRKTFTIIMATLLLLNVLGYYGLFLGLQYKNTQEFATRLDANNYSEAETFTIKVPLTLPYHVDDESFERVDGQIENNGEFFRLVKQKLAKDTLYIVCIKDTQSKQIKKALSDYVKTFTDKPVDGKHQGKTIPVFIKDYLPSEASAKSPMAEWHRSIGFAVLIEPLASSDLPIISPPPQA